MKAIGATEASLAVNVDAVAAAYAEELMAIFLNAGAEVRPYPSTLHEAVVARALKRHKHGNGQDGYRDVTALGNVA